MIKYKSRLTAIFKADLLIAISCLVLSMFFGSRSFVLGYTISIIFVIFSYWRFKVKKQIVFITFLTIILVGLLVSYLFKFDSTLGRILIYKISFNMLKDHYLWGIGGSKFPVEYGNYQIEYFRTGNYTIKELLLADNTTYAFNDYLQFFIIYGIPGLIILILSFLLIAISITFSLKKHPNNPGLLIVAISQLIAISIAALFMHIFEKPYFLALFLIALIIICIYAIFNRYKLLMSFSLIIITLLGITFFHYGSYIKNYSHYQKFKNARESFKTGHIRESYSYYKDAYPYLKNEIKFLLEYANILTVLHYNKEAEEVLKLLIQNNNANVFYQMLADCYYKNGKLKEAEDAYLNSMYRVPNRFKTRFSLFKFYIQTQRFKEASSVGKDILNLPVKVVSAEVMQIKKQVNNILISNGLE